MAGSLTNTAPPEAELYGAGDLTQTLSRSVSAYICFRRTVVDLCRPITMGLCISLPVSVILLQTTWLQTIARQVGITLTLHA